MRVRSSWRGSEQFLWPKDLQKCRNFWALDFDFCNAKPQSGSRKNSAPQSNTGIPKPALAADIWDQKNFDVLKIQFLVMKSPKTQTLPFCPCGSWLGLDSAAEHPAATPTPLAVNLTGIFGGFQWDLGSGQHLDPGGREEGRREVRLVFIHKLFTTYLYSNHRKDLDWDPVKFIKTAPGSCLGKAFVNIPTRLKRKKIK